MIEDFRKALLARHNEDDTICVVLYTWVNGELVADERFVTGVDAAAELIEANHRRTDIGAIWTNVQKLKPGSTSRKAVDFKAYMGVAVDIDRRWKQIHEDGSYCTHNKKEKKTCGSVKCNATGAEREVLRVCAEEIRGLASKYFGDDVFSDSGNGFHLEWRTDYFEIAEGEALYEDLLDMLKAKFEKTDVNMEIDGSVFNVSRVFTVAGTWNRKYPDLPGRPQRRSVLLSMPEKQAAVSRTAILTATAENVSSDREEEPSKRKDKDKANPEWQKNYGVGHFVEWFKKYVAYEGKPFKKADGLYHPVTPCYAHRDDPDGYEHEDKNQCCIIEFNNGGLGLSCWSKDFGLRTFIGMLNAKIVADGGQKYPHRVLVEKEIPEELFEDVPDAEEYDKLKYPDMVPDLDAVCPQGTKFRELVEAACVGGDLTGNKPFVLQPGFVIPAILTLASAIPSTDKMLGTRINLFTCLLAMSRAGKDVSWEHSAAVLGLGEKGNGYWMDYRPGGHSQMVAMLGDTKEAKTKENPSPRTIPGPLRMFGLSPELGGILKSAKGESSHMLETYNEFFDNNKNTTRERNTNRLITMNCRFSWGTSLAIGFDRIEEKRFTKVFGDSANDGFAQRDLFGFSETVVNSKDLEEWQAPAAEAEWVTSKDENASFEDVLNGGQTKYLYRLERHVVAGYAPGVREMYVAADVDFFPGCAYLFKKVMLAIACVNLHTEITVDDFNAAMAFMRWQGSIRDVFRPSQADDASQPRFQEMVLHAIQRADMKKGKAGVPMEKREINVQRLSTMNRWSNNDNRIGLDKTVLALRTYGDLILKEITEESEDGDITGTGRHDWTHARAVHYRGKPCWCKETH